MAKLRHIAVIVDDPDASARFFAQAFGMKRIADIPYGCHMSDGVISIALLRKDRPDERVGIDHFGIWVSDLAAAQDRAVAAGAQALPRRPASGHAFYEAKFRTADGIVFDLSETGWPGARLISEDD
jgi:methylmalonyl-CoA/ethylmalonyl-CoA epimerase